MPNIVVNRRIVLSGNPPPYDADAEAYFLRATATGTSFTPIQQSYITNLFIRLKTEKGTDGTTSQWDSLDVLNLPGATKEILGLNVKTSSFGNWIYNINSGTYTAYKGYKGNGSTTRVDSGFNPFDGLYAYKFTTTDNCFGAYITSNTMEIKALVSSLDASTRGFELRTHTSLAIAINGRSTENTTDACDSTGSFSSKRTSSNNNYGIYKNAKPSTLSVGATNATTTTSFKLFCRNLNGAFSLYSSNRICFLYFGSSNVDIQKLERAIIEEYLKPVGGALVKRVVFDGNSFLQQVTMPKKVMADLWTAGIECTSLFNGVFGIKWPVMTTNAPTLVDPYRESYFTHEAFLAWENTNDIATVSGNTPSQVFSHQQTYIAARKAAGWGNILISTCIPATSITEADRENGTTWNDPNTLNGKIRNGWSATLLADALADPAQDARFDSSSDTGSADYSGDGVHLSTTGYNYLATTYLTPPIQTFLT